MSSLEIVQLMNREDLLGVHSVSVELPKIARAIDGIVERFRRGGRLIYLGAGTSGRLGVLDASECPPTFSTDPAMVRGLIAGGEKALTSAVEGAEDHPEFAIRDLQAIQLSEADTLVGIATSGRTPYVIGGLKFARELGAFTMGLSCVRESELEAVCELHLNPLSGPEVLTGSTRLKAGTVTKLILNMLTTGAMIRLGKTLGNLMVDLRATNIKLKARTARILRHFSGLDSASADRVLEHCNGELKTALVSQMLNVAPEVAREKLRQANGQIHVLLPNPSHGIEQVRGVSTLLDPEGVVQPQRGVDLRSTPRETQDATATTVTRAEESKPEYPDLFLGIDGGGTKTQVLLGKKVASGWEILGRGQAGPSNIHGVGFETATNHLRDGIETAFRQAGLRMGRVDSICFGLAGAGREEDRNRIQVWAEKIGFAQRVRVVGDVELILGNHSGIALVCGTGSIVWGRNTEGQTARAGGWGPLLGDETSGYGLVLQAIRAVLRSHENRGPETILKSKLLTAFGVDSPPKLISLIHGGEWDRTRIATVASTILDANEEGDPVAMKLIGELQAELIESVLSVREQLKLSGTCSLFLTGGLILNSACLRNGFIRRLQERGAFEVHLVHEPARGALELASVRLDSSFHAKPRVSSVPS
jgi:N-acetylmuramic acid 6-phosphate etherase